MTESNKEDQRSTEYEEFADTVGLVPNVRAKDNLYQGIAIGVTTLIGLGVGYFIEGGNVGLAVGALAGAMAGLFISGIALMFIGFMRK